MSDTVLWWLVFAAICVCFFVAIAWRSAVRLDRLHRQVVHTRGGLDVLLVRRAWAAMALSTSELLDPASAALIGQAAQDCLQAAPALTADGLEPAKTYSLADAALTPHSRPRQACESVLTQVLRQTLTREVRDELNQCSCGRELLAELYRANQRVAYARRFHNDHVARTVKLRSHLLTRLLRLAGHAALPDAVDIDDLLTV